jgi:O-antigen/teichoic acid export membrane protein
MKKKFVTNLAFLLGLNLLIKPFWIFGIDRSVQNTIGAEDYGMYAALFNFSFLFNILLDAGITNFNNRNISQNQQLLDKHLSGIIVIRIMLAGIFFMISCLFGWMLGYRLPEFRLLFIMLFNQVLISFILYLRSNLAGLQMFKTDSVVSVMDRSIMIIVCGILLWSNVTNVPFRVEWFVWSQTLAYLVTACFALLVLLRKTGFRRLSWNRPFFIMILKKSYPYAILILLMTFSYRIDAVMLERLLPDGALQAGIYAQAYRLLDATTMIAYLFAGLLLPMYSRMLKLRENVEELTRLSFSLIIVHSILATIAAFTFSGDIMHMLYHEHASESASILGLLMTSFVAMSSNYIFGTLLTAGGNLRVLNYTALCGMLLNISLNLVLIPKFKITGAAAACLATQGFTAITQVLIARRTFSFHTNWSFIFRLIAFIILAIVIFKLLDQTSMMWIWSLTLASVLVFLAAFMLRIIKWRDLTSLV